MPDNSPAPPDDAADPSRAGAASAAKSKRGGKALPHTTALRRRRLQVARYLQFIACLREEADEMRAEISSLEFIIGAQADAIDALRREMNDSKK